LTHLSKKKNTLRSLIDSLIYKWVTMAQFSSQFMGLCPPWVSRVSSASQIRKDEGNIHTDGEFCGRYL